MQSTRGVRRVQAVGAELLRETLDELEADLPAAGIKIGMLGGAPQVREVARFVQTVRSRRRVTVVVDPVLISSSGAVLLDAEGLAVLQQELLPAVDALTPNASEASLLSGLPFGDASEAEMCAATLAARYPQMAVVVTGGHLEPPSDMVWQQGSATWLRGERIQTRATHGTGCVFSSALLSARLLGEHWPAAAATAKAFVAEAMRNARPLGSGYGPMQLVSHARQQTS